MPSNALTDYVASQRMGRFVERHSSAHAVLFIDSFEYNDSAEFERADDLLIRRPNAGKNHAD